MICQLLILALCNGVISILESPVLTYCITSNHKPECSGLKGAETNVSSGPFDFRNISQHVVSRNPTFIGDAYMPMDIVLICQAPYPIKWLAQKPIQENMEFVQEYSLDANKLQQPGNTSTEESSFSLRVVVDLCDHNEAISGRWRCQSFENPNAASDIYLDFKRDRNSIPTNYRTIFYNESRLTQQDSVPFVPCNRIDIHGDIRKRSIVYKVCGANKTHVDLTDDNFDPRIGFRINSIPSSDCFYKCCTKQLCNKIIPLNWDNRVQAALNYTDDAKTVSCNSTLETAGWLMVGKCNSVPECDLKFGAPFPEIYLSPQMLERVVIGEQIILNGSTEFGANIEINHSFSNGYVACSSNYDLLKKNFVYEVDYFFTGLDNRIYPLSQDVPPQSLISLTTKLETTKSSRSSRGIEVRNLVATCTISRFVLHSSVYFEVTFSNGSVVRAKCTDVENTLGAVFQKKLSHHGTKLGTTAWDMKLQASTNMSHVSCISPWFNSTNLARATQPILFSTTDDLSDSEELPKEGSIIHFSVIVAVVLSAVVVVVATGIVLGCVWQKYRSAVNTIYTLTREEIDVFHNGNSQNNLRKCPTIVDTASYPFPDNMKISEDNLTITDRVLGEGEFGIVREGKWDGMLVAVKSTKTSADLDYFRAFLQEIKVMAYIAGVFNENIVQFHGAVVNRIHEKICFALIEHSPFGNLSNYLRSFSKSDYSECLAMENLPSTTVLISFGRQIATGMEFLVSQKVIHGDLAARNVLVFENDVVKITDFGLSRKLYNCSNYVKTKQTLLPWRWMAPESLRFLKFSHESDVWSYGVTLWEIFSLGEIPFSGLHYSSNFPDQIEAGLTLAKPEWATESLYGLMRKCWEASPKMRPSFSECRATCSDNSVSVKTYET